MDSSGKTDILSFNCYEYVGIEYALTHISINIVPNP